MEIMIRVGGSLQFSPCLIDEDCVELLSPYKLVIYARRSNGYKTVVAVRDGMLVPISRLIMGEPAGLLVDHKNGDTLDNRRENLRLATRQQNRTNTGIQQNNTSGYKGVYRSGSLWSASITVNYRKVSLGSYLDPEDAAKAYDVAALKYFGEFAKTNFPLEELTNVDLTENPLYGYGNTLTCSICGNVFNYSGSGKARYCLNCM